jgi:hypothetical protein
VTLQPLTLQGSKTDISHCWQDARLAYDYGRMDGFYQEPPEKLQIAQCPSLRPPLGTGPDSPYTYVPSDGPAYVRGAGPYWNMARQYVLADHFFPTDFGPSFTAHQDLVASTVEIANNLSLVNYPGTPTAAGGVEYNPGAVELRFVAGHPNVDGERARRHQPRRRTVPMLHAVPNAGGYAR